MSISDLECPLCSEDLVRWREVTRCAKQVLQYTYILLNTLSGNWAWLNLLQMFEGKCLELSCHFLQWYLSLSLSLSLFMFIMKKVGTDSRHKNLSAPSTLLMNGWKHKLSEKVEFGQPAGNIIYQSQRNTKHLPVILKRIQNPSPTVPIWRWQFLKLSRKETKQVQLQAGTTTLNNLFGKENRIRG